MDTQQSGFLALANIKITEHRVLKITRGPIDPRFLQYDILMHWKVPFSAFLSKHATYLRFNLINITL